MVEGYQLMVAAKGQVEVELLVPVPAEEIWEVVKGQVEVELSVPVEELRVAAEMKAVAGRVLVVLVVVEKELVEELALGVAVVMVSSEEKAVMVVSGEENAAAVVSG